MNRMVLPAPLTWQDPIAKALKWRLFAFQPAARRKVVGETLNNTELMIALTIWIRFSIKEKGTRRDKWQEMHYMQYPRVDSISFIPILECALTPTMRFTFHLPMYTIRTPWHRIYIGKQRILMEFIHIGFTSNFLSALCTLG